MPSAAASRARSATTEAPVSSMNSMCRPLTLASTTKWPRASGGTTTLLPYEFAGAGAGAGAGAAASAAAAGSTAAGGATGVSDGLIRNLGRHHPQADQHSGKDEN